MKPLRIGHVDLDTSHPGSWIPIIRELGHEVVGVVDHGDIHPEGYAKSFAEEREIPNVFSSIDEMVGEVDLAIIHSCNWDKHIERARPFIEAGKGVLIDKPMVGTLEDMTTLLEWEKKGHRVTGGSSVYYCQEAQEFLAQASAERGDPRFVYAGCGVDEYNYGIHAYALAHVLMGEGAKSARYLGVSGSQIQVEATWGEGRRATIAVGQADAYLPFYATVVTERGVHHLQVNNRNLYRSYLSAVLPYFSGEIEAPYTLTRLLEVERIAVAAHVSRENHGVHVPLNDIPWNHRSYDGRAFEAEYRLARQK